MLAGARTPTTRRLPPLCNPCHCQACPSARLKFARRCLRLSCTSPSLISRNNGPISCPSCLPSCRCGTCPLLYSFTHASSSVQHQQCPQRDPFVLPSHGVQTIPPRGAQR
jgi:hypothetical protein